jgi:hypothetical protein
MNLTSKRGVIGRAHVPLFTTEGAYVDFLDANRYDILYGLGLDCYQCGSGKEFGLMGGRVDLFIDYLEYGSEMYKYVVIEAKNCCGKSDAISKTFSAIGQLHRYTEGFSQDVLTACIASNIIPPELVGMVKGFSLPISLIENNRVVYSSVNKSTK